MKKITFLLFCLSTVMHLSAQSIVIGTGTDVTNGSGSDPIDCYFKSMKYQVVYTVAELSASLTAYDEITSLGFSISEAPGAVTLANYTIKMGHTSAANSANPIATANQTVKNAFTYTPTATAAGSFDMISFDTNFVWNGTENIVIEICTSGPNTFATPYGGVRVTTVAAGSRNVRSDSSNSCNSNTETTNGNRPNIQLTYVEGTAPTDVLDYYNLQYPASGSISAGSTYDVYAQAYEAGLTDVTTGQAPGIQAWIGYSLDNTNPNTPSWTWVPATFNAEVGNNDEYMLNLGSFVPTLGTFYYASRWSLNNAPFTYGGIQADGSYGGTWGEDNNISGVLTVNGPSNDDCANATLLTVDSDLSCSNPISGTTLGSTQSLAGCVGTANDDVWYSFVAIGAKHTITITNTGGNTDIVTQVFDGCGGNSLVCQDTPNSPIILTGLTPLNTYYFRIYTYSSTATVTTSFTVCVGTPPGPPANDACAGANEISALPYSFSQTDGAGSTNNDGFILSCEPTDDGGMNDGLWYTFTPATDGTVDIIVSNVGGWDPQLDLYSGSCGTFTCVTNADGGANSGNESIVGQAVTAGTQYFINVGHYSQSTDASEGNFDISVTGTFTLGVNEVNNTNTFSYFPNPVKNELTLKAQSLIENVSIYNMLGQEVLRIAPNNMESVVNMNQLQAGAFFVKVTINNVTETIRVIKQ